MPNICDLFDGRWDIYAEETRDDYREALKFGVKQMLVIILN